MTLHRALIGLGSNLGDPPLNLERAFAALGSLGVVRRRSSLYRTKPWGKSDQPDFVNAAAALETRLPPGVLLAALKAIEKRQGRTAGERWGPRTIDLDLLAYDDLEIDDAGLRVPHPALLERAFVLVPLAEIDPAYAPARDALPESELSDVTLLKP